MIKKVVFGECTRITKSIVRGVAKIEIEIPVESFKDAINAIDGLPVIVTVPDETPGSAYGVYGLPDD